MISEFEKKQIDDLQHSSDIKACVKLVSETDNPFFLYEYTQAYNWDDGFEIPNAVADNESCDLGIALSLFWLAEAMCYLTKEIVRDEYNNEWADFCEKMIYKITNGHYEYHAVNFEPKLGKVEEYKLRKIGVPEIFFTEAVATSQST